MSQRTAERRPIQSMTGYALARRDTPAGQLSVELRSVNARFLDLTLRVPDELRLVEPALRDVIGTAIQRGKLECRVGLRTHGANTGDTPPSLDPVALQRLLTLHASLQHALPQAAPLSIGEVLRWPGIVAEPASAESLVPAILEAAREALAEFQDSRAREGARLVEMMLERVDRIEAIADQVASRAPELLSLHEARLVERLRSALDRLAAGSPEQPAIELPIDETMARVRQEVTLHGMRIDVDEEIGRLKAHVAELRRILAGTGPAGKRMDFLLQEFNREANTIGSKAAALEMTHAAIELKLLVEQIREQVQNLE